jgi:hypothetical protein
MPFEAFILAALTQLSTTIAGHSYKRNACPVPFRGLNSYGPVFDIKKQAHKGDKWLFESLFVVIT